MHESGEKAACRKTGESRQLACLRLTSPHSGVAPLTAKQGGMIALLCNMTVFQNDDLVRLGDGGQAMRHRNGGAPARGLGKGIREFKGSVREVEKEIAWSSTVQSRVERMLDYSRRGAKGEFCVGVPPGIAQLAEARQRVESRLYDGRHVFPQHAQ